MLKRINNHKLVYTFFILFVLVSCDSKRVFDNYTAIDNGLWEINAPVTFQFPIQDTLAQRNLFINIRNNNNYQYSNLFLITKMSFPDGNQLTDTLEYDMTDKRGRFLGTGFSEIKENKLFYKEQIQFPTSGDYQIQIFQAMRKNGEVNGIEQLQGITDVGFRIEKIE
ncbi:gliding motility lipoprotein GldH [Tenacibaculum agarivorans]|uniref:gliding motility lipoprotein GldH n=1 Tax=Tenacibaculum agarivorans TaxID=1908389 RepID=UPI00094BC360|nr:gliding motility lipoprotein GldH [Tenacibaculum agarivorans]